MVASAVRRALPALCSQAKRCSSHSNRTTSAGERAEVRRDQHETSSATIEASVHVNRLQNHRPQVQISWITSASSTDGAKTVEQRDGQLRWTDRTPNVIQPTIAAIDSFCVAGGLELALACDIHSYCHAQCTLRAARGEVGILPGGGGTQRLGKIVGLGVAMRMILTGDEISAEVALNSGLATDLFDKQELDDAALAIAPWNLLWIKG
ncbi:hypothetical protein CIC12_24405 [Burkholderia sp. SG-MS1]|nr:hypothetical protein [Paraburkholderia sp. SG-MS1]